MWYLITVDNDHPSALWRARAFSRFPEVSPNLVDVSTFVSCMVSHARVVGSSRTGLGKCFYNGAIGVCSASALTARCQVRRPRRCPVRVASGFLVGRVCHTFRVHALGVAPSCHVKAFVVWDSGQFPSSASGVQLGFRPTACVLQV